VRPSPVRFARNGPTSIAYQIAGDGPLNLALVVGPVSRSEMLWEHPRGARFLGRLASFSRLVLHDRRGTGASDPVDHPPTVDEQADDLMAVLDALSIERFALVGTSEAARMAAYVAASHPDRVTALVLYALSPAGAGVRQRPEVVQMLRENIAREWGTATMLPLFAPSLVGDERFAEWWCRYMRACASPGVAFQFLESALMADVTAVLPAIRVPTLVVHRAGDRLAPAAEGRAAAQQIPGARWVELDGQDNMAMGDGADALVDEIEEFLTGRRTPVRPDRILATLLFTDIVDSTRRAAELGDAGWRDLLDRHDALVRSLLARHAGREIKSTGDGFFAAFDGPAKAIAASRAIVEGVHEIGLEVRAGIHTGECERRGEDLGGMAVHIGARVAARAAAGEILVSSTVRDLTVGSSFEFDDRGAHELKGVPGTWQLLAVRN
jgi:class 3 adenylate cyclase